MLLSTPDLDEFVRMAHLDLTEAQTADLLEMLHLQSTGKWRWPTWTVTDPRSDASVIARALIGLLILDENVLWTAPRRPVLKDAFERLVHAVNQLGAADTVKVRRANGEERIERLDTGKRIQFICTHLPGSGRGYSCDLLVVGQGSKYNQVDCDLMPTMAARSNPQIVYV